ncbi:UMP-CMP kinase 2, mitochondrial [Eublepharis macularius]|uniref:UMP-CMP kinase 2, mitochondrial n=1 Tax=Eublepharis macularius TaxID=481883 RepID=A0AA97JLK6_EUBMA|nr:UMP-CMP kinase 2, mitochondrial [Eublepharis macularius]
MPRRGRLSLSLLLSCMAQSPPRRAERCFVAELPGSELVYFTCSRSAPLGAAALRPRGFLPPPGRCYSFCIPPAQSPRERVRAARLHGQLQQRLSRAPLGAGARVLPLLSYSPADAAAPEPGFLVQATQAAAEAERALEELLRLHLPAPVHLSVYEEAADGQVWRTLWRLQGAPEGKELLGRVRVLPAPEPLSHPAAAHLLGAAVFGSREAARGVLEECTSLIPEAKAVLDLVDKCPKLPKKGDFPVIVIEGLDATGKTTVTQSLRDSLGAVLLKTPPSCVSQWRKTFDDEPTLVRRAFYALTNYIVASEIAKESTKSPVIIDRFWHSTAAYAIATEISGKVLNLPPLHHPVYCWPEDLLKPDVVILLTVSPEERIRRLQERGIEKTREEEELEANRFFHQKVEGSYRRMENPSCELVDASGSREQVLEDVLHQIKKHFPLL